jgi:quercetin dioxygenase-like cupin family protein
MIQNRIYDIKEQSFTATREDLAAGVSGFSLLPQESLTSKIILTRVKSGGEFLSHRDSYHHLFYFIKGEGEISLADETYEIKPGRVVEVPAGETHGYKNTADDEMLLLTINIKSPEQIYD